MTSDPTAKRGQRLRAVAGERDVGYRWHQDTRRADDGELTRTRKVRRGVIAEKYGSIIDALYSDTAFVDIDTWILFQDGTRQRIVTKLKNESLEAETVGGGRG